MPIPGNYCFGILEEDNPQKSYFRFKPLLLAHEGTYVPFQDQDAYPEEGCIRIVPDKNESNRFKTRMRQMGCYAIVDLREHPNENDKIRPNKNYRADGGEQNANIIYSDVIQEPPLGAVVEILSLDAPEDEPSITASIPMPTTASVALRGADGEFNPFVWICAHAEDGVLLTRTEIPCPGAEAFTCSYQDFLGVTRTFLLAKPDTTLIPASGKAQPSLPEAQNAAERQQDEGLEPYERGRSGQEHGRRTHFRDDALLMQSGLNPRHSRSLQEVIEDKWRHSRLDQLGHPVPPEAMGSPVLSPIERALYAVQEVWSSESARSGLMVALSGIEGFLSDRLARSAYPEEGDPSEEEDALEARRLRLRDEIESLRAERLETHEKLVEEIRKTNARLFEEGETRLGRQRAEAERLEEKLNQLHEKLNTAEGAPESRIFIGRAEPDELSPGELISAVRAAFENAGHALDNDDAVALLAWTHLSPILLFSGQPGSGKTSTAALLAEALGAKRAQRYLHLLPAEGPADYQNTLSELLACQDCVLPIFAHLDDINLAGRGQVQALQQAMDREDINPALRLLLTAQDAPYGAPLSPTLLDRAALIRLRPEPSTSEWILPVPGVQDSAVTVSAENLGRVFAADPEAVDDAVLLRMRYLRTQLGSYGTLLSRRTLDAIWRFCAAAGPHMQRDSMQVFDLAFAQRALPCILATAPLTALHRLPELFKDMPECQRVLTQPMPIEV